MTAEYRKEPEALVHPLMPGGESTAAALRRTEQERDAALIEVFGVRASLNELADEVEDLKGMLAMRAGQLMAFRRRVQQADAERDLARAELASARQEIEHLRAQVASEGSYIDELIAARDATIKLLEYALHLRMHGECAPGGRETWAEFDRRCEAFLRAVREDT
jgi:chromosome segregation ATPase